MKTLRNTIKQTFAEQRLLALIGLGLCLIPISNSVGQVPLYLASVWWVVEAFRKRERVSKEDLFWMGGFALIVLVSFSYTVRMENSVEKLNRFLLFPLLFAVPSQVLAANDPRKAARGLSLCLIAGVCVLGVYDLIRIPLQVIRDGREWVDCGNMTSPQFYMTGLLLFLGLTAVPAYRRLPLWLCGGMGSLLVGGLLIHQKRGVWLACMLAVGFWVLVNRQGKVLLVMLLIGCGALTLPQVRERLIHITEVVAPDHGSRSTLWVHVAPNLLPNYPFGMGYNASEFEDFREVMDPNIHLQPGLRHLHNNVLQIRLELGWHGVIFWGGWMLWVLVRGLQQSWKARQDTPELALLLNTATVALLGLLLNGVVEYNFGDSEVLMVYLTLLGLITALRAGNMRGNY